MSKGLKPTVYVDDYLSNVAQARDYAMRAEKDRNDLKLRLWGMIISTPKDVVANGKDPIVELKETFEDIWSELWDAFIDDYKYSIIADDAEFDSDSLVRKEWDEEEKERKEYEERQKKREKFFNEHSDVLSSYNFDDITLYNEYELGNIDIPSELTKEKRDELLNEIKRREQELINKAIKEMRKNE